jgi:hydroxymethylpyrimidine pyrophosphatase-like HAD family hydrolase
MTSPTGLTDRAGRAGGAAPARFPAAIFFDLDGTLLAPGAVLTRPTMAALAAAAGAGATLVLATGGFSGRTHLIARTLAASVPGGVWAITHNGAAIWDPAGRLVYHHPMPAAALEAALAHAGRRLWVTYEAVHNAPAAAGPGGATGTRGAGAGAGGGEQRTGVYYAGRLRPEIVTFLWGPQAPPVEAGAAGPTAEGIAVGLEPRWDWRGARSPGVYREGAVLGCWCIGTPDALAPLDAVARAGRGHLAGARYLPWSKRLGQFIGRPRLALLGRDLGAADASKGAAAGWLCDHLGIEPAQTAAFGDAANDVELLAFAGCAVVMANATPQVLELGDLMAPPNYEDGVAQVLRDWVAGAPRTVLAVPAAPAAGD